MNMIRSAAERPGDTGFQSSAAVLRQPLVIVACDAPDTVDQLKTVCEFFEVAVEVLSDRGELMQLLRDHRPMAMIGDVDGKCQDGFHAMKIVASYDRDLPVMLLTGGDPVSMGAADAVQETWGLTMVSRSTSSPLAGQLADFLFTAGRRAGCMRLVQV
jgi:hypothetical protein